MADTLVVAIMAGGAGTRFWPASTERRPKQFLALAGERTLLQQSYDRARALTDKIFVVTNAAFIGLVGEQLPQLGPGDVVGEPERKDTAAAAVLATLLAERRFPGCTLVILTSDHVIGPVDEFARTVRAAAADLAAGAGDALYTLGIPPAFPATGYGYLELGAPVDDVESAPSGPAGVVRRSAVQRFVEKPDAATAKRYVDGGRHLWNSGMFVWRAAAALAQMREHLPQHVAALEPAAAALADPAASDAARAAAMAQAFAAVPKVSVDYGLMEKARNVRCAAATFSWSDVGSFAALAEHMPEDAQQNAHRGRVASLDARGNVVWCEDDGELVALLGVDDLVVVRAGKRTLVTRKSRAEDIKKLVDTLDKGDRS